MVLRVLRYAQRIWRIPSSRWSARGSEYRHAAEKSEMVFYPSGTYQCLTQQQTSYEATPCHPPTPQQQASDYYYSSIPAQVLPSLMPPKNRIAFTIEYVNPSRLRKSQVRIRNRWSNSENLSSRPGYVNVIDLQYLHLHCMRRDAAARTWINRPSLCLLWHYYLSKNKNKNIIFTSAPPS